MSQYPHSVTTCFFLVINVVGALICYASFFVTLTGTKRKANGPGANKGPASAAGWRKPKRAKFDSLAGQQGIFFTAPRGKVPRAGSDLLQIADRVGGPVPALSFFFLLSSLLSS